MGCLFTPPDHPDGVVIEIPCELLPAILSPPGTTLKATQVTQQPHTFRVVHPKKLSTSSKPYCIQSHGDSLGVGALRVALFAAE